MAIPNVLRFLLLGVSWICMYVMALGAWRYLWIRLFKKGAATFELLPSVRLVDTLSDAVSHSEDAPSGWKGSGA